MKEFQAEKIILLYRRACRDARNRELCESLSAFKTTEDLFAALRALEGLNTFERARKAVFQSEKILQTV